MQNRNEIAAELLAIIANNPSHSMKFKRASNKFDELFKERILDLSIKWSLSFARSGVETDSQEICQDIILKVFDRAGQFNPKKGHIDGWLYRIVRNEFLERKREYDRQLFTVKFVPLSDRIISTLRVTKKTDNGTVKLNARAEMRKKEFKRMDAALKTLSPVKEDIMRTKLLYAPENMPDHEKERITITYRIKPKTIDTYWMRGKAEVEKVLGQPVDWSLFEPVDRAKSA